MDTVLDSVSPHLRQMYAIRFFIWCIYLAFFRIVLLALCQSYDSPKANEATQEAMGKSGVATNICFSHDWLFLRGSIGDRWIPLIKGKWFRASMFVYCYPEEAGPLLRASFNFNPCMDTKSHAQWSVGWNYIYIYPQTSRVALHVYLGRWEQTTLISAIL